MLMLTAELSAPGGTVNIGLETPPAAATVQPVESHRVAHPDDRLQVSVGLLHTTGVPPQTPAVHTSPVVQLFPSLHDAPLGALMIAGHRGCPPPWTQPCVSSTWQAD